MNHARLQWDSLVGLPMKKTHTSHKEKAATGTAVLLTMPLGQDDADYFTYAAQTAGISLGVLSGVPMLHTSFPEPGTPLCTRHMFIPAVAAGAGSDMLYIPAPGATTYLSGLECTRPDWRTPGTALAGRSARRRAS